MSDDNDRYIIQDEIEDDQLANIARLGNDFVRLSNEVMKLENMLELRKKQLNVLSTAELPDAMAKVYMTEFRLMNGYKLKIKPVLVCKLPKENADVADQWLIDNGHDGMVKRNITIEVPKGIPAETYATITETIKKNGLNYNDTKVIHPQTLNKWAREMEEGNEVIPEEIFSVFRGTKTEITE